MGGNQSSVVNEAVTSIVSSYITKNKAFIDRKHLDNTEAKQIMENNYKNALIEGHCTIVHDMSIKIISRVDVKINSQMSTDQSADMMRDLMKKLNNDISQEMKGLPLGGNNDVTVQNIINNLIKTDISSDTNNIIKNVFEQLVKTDQKMINNGEGLTCKDYAKLTFDIGLGYNNAVNDATKAISESIQQITELDKVQETIDNHIKQKNIGLDLTMVLIVAVICAMIYFMAESGTLGQLGSVFKGGSGGKSRSSGGIELPSFKRSPVTSRSSLLSKAAPALKEAAMFGAFGSRKAWWTGL